MWKMDMAHFKILFWNLSGRTDRNHEKLRIVGLQARIST
jgi:hypothetical protein